MPEPTPSKPVVWVVDDSPMERAITLKALGGEYACEQFGDGSEAVERLSNGGPLPDVVLLDWVMPGMSGDEVCRYVRAHPTLAELAIVLFTASRVEIEDVVRGLSLGANDYVPKPFAPEELRARVAAVLRGKRDRETASRERTRLAAINRLGRALFHSGGDVPTILRELVTSLHGLVADGCAILLLPGDLEPISLAVHRVEPDAATLGAIASLADPGVFSFESTEDALAKLPPLYHPYIQRFGLRGLAILPFPIRNPVQGVVTLTRDAGSQPFDEDDLAAIETCIEYASLAVQNAVRFQTERQARAQLTAVLEHAPIGIVVTDRAGTVELANPVARRLIPGISIGQSRDDVYALGAWTTTAGAALDREAWLRTESGGGASRRQLVLTPPGQAARVLSLSAVTRGEVDSLSGTVTAIEDVTAQHAVAVERERTAAFQEQMLGIVGHDLRNPLSAIVTGAELIAEMTRELPRIQNVVSRVQASSQRMTNIVNQLLDVTRARLGEGIPIASTNVDLAALVRGLADELSSAYRTARFVVEAEPVRGVWDPDRLGQVIANLAGNAAQYGDTSKPIMLRVRAEGEHAVIEVANALKGPPIPPERIATLFDPYQRGEHSAITHRTGLGLGLYIAHEIVRAHHGHLTASSTDRDGTVFRVELPLRGT